MDIQLHFLFFLLLLWSSVLIHRLNFDRSRNPWWWNPGTRTGARLGGRILFCHSEFHRRNDMCQYLGSGDKGQRNYAPISFVPDRVGERVSLEPLYSLLERLRANNYAFMLELKTTRKYQLRSTKCSSVDFICRHCIAFIIKDKNESKSFAMVVRVLHLFMS